MNPITWLSSRSKTSTHVLIMLILAVVVLLLPAGQWDLRGPDEGRYAQIGKELLSSDNWFALKVMGKPYDQKPPLAFWLFATAIKANGGEPDSWFLRVPSVLCAIGMLMITYRLGKKRGGPSTGILSAIMLLSSYSFLDDAPTVELNMIFSFFITASLAPWLLNIDRERLTWPQWAIMWLALAAAFLVKGPLALLVVLSALGYTAIASRSLRPLKAVRIHWGLLLVFALAGIWFLAQSRAFGSHFVEKQVSQQTVHRFLKGDHKEPFWFYFPRLFTSLIGPWAILFCAGSLHLWRNRGKNPPFDQALTGWFFIPFIILTIANGKRVPYLLPLLPVACLIAGHYTAVHLAPYVMRRRYSNTLSTILWLLCAMIFVFAIALYFPDRIFHGQEWAQYWNPARLSPLAFLGFSFLLFLIAKYYTFSRHLWAEGVWALALAILTVQLADFTMIRPAMDPGKSTREFSKSITDILKLQNESTLLTLPQMGEPEYHAYSHYKVLTVKKSRLDLTDRELPSVLVMKDGDVKSSESAVLAAGFVDAFHLNVTKDQVRVYIRQRPLLPESHVE